MVVARSTAVEWEVNVGLIELESLIWIIIIIAKLQRNGYRGNGVDVSYGCSDITEVVSCLLNEDTEAADVMALGRELL